MRTEMDVVAQQFFRNRGDGGNRSKYLGLSGLTVVAGLGQIPIERKNDVKITRWNGNRLRAGRRILDLHEFEA